MSIRVGNQDNQLNIETNDVVDVYNFDVIKSVSRAVDASGNNYISINFIANDKNNSVRIPLKEVVSPPTWTNDTAGAIKAVEDIRLWMDDVVSAIITSPLGQQPPADSVSTVLSTEQANVLINTIAKRFTGADDNAGSFGNTIFSISFASVGTADARISFDGGTVYLILKPGETLNLDAGGVMNYYDAVLITWDTTTNAGSSLLIAANYI
jgi:hypothetical protein